MIDQSTIFYIAFGLQVASGTYLVYKSGKSLKPGYGLNFTEMLITATIYIISYGIAYYNLNKCH